MTPFYKRRLFWLLFGLPNLLSILYFGAIAAPQYVSSSSVIVYQSSAAGVPPASAQFGQAAGLSVEGDYLVQSFIVSWHCFEALDAKALRRSWSRGDFITRFGGVGGLFGGNVTDLYHYYLGHVRTHIDNNSAIMTVSVRGYDPAFVLALNREILARSEAALTAINMQAYQNAESFFKVRVQAAKDHLQQVLAAQADTPQAQQFNHLTLKKIALEARLSALEKQPAAAAQLRDLRSEIAGVEAQLASLPPAQLGEGAVYDQLLVQDAESNLLSMETQLLVAQQAALQHLYFMDYVTRPAVPPNPTAPSRLVWVLCIMAGTFLFYLIVKPTH